MGMNLTAESLTPIEDRCFPAPAVIHHLRLHTHFRRPGPRPRRRTTDPSRRCSDRPEFRSDGTASWSIPRLVELPGELRTGRCVFTHAKEYADEWRDD